MASVADVAHHLTIHSVAIADTRHPTMLGSTLRPLPLGTTGGKGSGKDRKAGKCKGVGRDSRANARGAGVSRKNNLSKWDADDPLSKKQPHEANVQSASQSAEARNNNLEIERWKNSKLCFKRNARNSARVMYPRLPSQAPP